MKTTNKETIFKKIDNFFKQRKESEQKLIYIMTFGLIVYIFYQFVYPSVEELKDISYNNMISLKNEVNQKELYLRVNSNAKLAALRKSLENDKIKYENNIYKISYIDNSLKELSYLLFNDENWAKFVDNISYLAKKYHLEIKEITNKFYKPTFKKVSQVVTIEVKTKSDYKSMMKFLNKIEESKLVVDVSDLNISKPSSKLSSYFKISVWGMRY